MDSALGLMQLTFYLALPTTDEKLDRLQMSINFGL